MTGGRAFTFFLFVALLAPLVLFAVVRTSERWAPSVHAWTERHANALNWGLALFFFLGAVSALLRPAVPEASDPIDGMFHSTLGRLAAFVLCVANGIDHVRRARRRPQPVAQQSSF